MFVRNQLLLLREQKNLTQPNPYKIFEMNSESFINWKIIAGKMGKNFNINTDAEKVGMKLKL